MERKMFLIFCLFFTNILITNSLIIQLSHGIEHDGNIVNCLLKVKEITQHPIIYTGNINEPELRNEVNALVKALHRNEIPHFITNDVKMFIKRAENFETLVLIFVEKCSDITIVEEGFTLNKHKFLILIADYAKDCEDLDTFGRKFEENDVTFITTNSRRDYRFVTYIPELDDMTCRLTNNVSQRTINSCTGGVLENSVVFPFKFPTNLNKCPLNVGISPHYPFADVNATNENMSPVENVSGSDVELVKIISEYFNSTLKWFFLSEKQPNTHTHTDLSTYFSNGDLDFCVGGLYRIYGDRVAYSGIYHKQVITWMYYVGRQKRSWQSLVKKLNGIYIFFTFYIVYSVTWFVVSKFDTNSACLTDTLVYSWGALLGGSSLRDGRTRKQKILNIVYMYMCIHLSAYISVQFFSFLTIQGPPHMLKTNDDVMESGRIAYLNPETKNFIEDQKYLAFASKSEDCFSFHDCQMKVLDSNGLTVVIEGYFVPFQTITSVNDEARVMSASENLLTTYHEMVLKKDSYLNVRFKKIIMRLFEAGICDRLVKEAIGLIVVDKAETAAKKISSNSYSCQEGCSITLSQSAGAFYVWAIGCSVSFVVFLMELFLREIKSYK